MKVLATFDGSNSSEAILPQLEWMARLPDAEFTLLSVVCRPRPPISLRRLSRPMAGAPSHGPAVAEVTAPAALPTSQDDELDQEVASRADYLSSLVSRLPRGSVTCVSEVVVADDVGAAIIQYAMKHQADVIVMAMHGETGMIHRVFGDVAEEVVRSRVAPVLLVH